MNLEFLSRDIGGLPAWAWGLIVGGGALGLVIFLRRQQGGPGSTLGQNNQAPTDPTYGGVIDPFTGVPYSIESQVNPATGLPNYYNPDPAPTPTPTPTPAGEDIQYTKAPMTLSAFLAQFGLSAEKLYYDPHNAGLRQIINALWDAQGKKGDPKRKFDTVVLPAGTAVWTGVLPSQPPVSPVNPPPGPQRMRAGAGPAQPYQATPFWPVMTDVNAAGRAV